MISYHRREALKRQGHCFHSHNCSYSIKALKRIFNFRVAFLNKKSERKKFVDSIGKLIALGFSTGDGCLQFQWFSCSQKLNMLVMQHKWMIFNWYTLSLSLDHRNIHSRILDIKFRIPVHKINDHATNAHTPLSVAMNTSIKLTR